MCCVLLKRAFFSGLNNLDVYSVMNDTYSDVFGFTPEEITRMADDLNIVKALPELKRWYDGYRIGKSEI